MSTQTPIRDTLFISKATPGDDAFILWLAPRLEAAGFRVFADIFGLDGGDEWRGKLTQSLQDDAVKMLLCCSNETLGRRGVKEEIAIAEDLSRDLGDPNFIIPLRIRDFKKLFGIGGIQYIDFKARWADGLSDLLESLQRQAVPKASAGVIQPEWAQYQRRRATSVEHSPELLTSNWIRIVRVPDSLAYVRPKNPYNEKTIRKLGESYEYPMVEFESGFLTFASTLEMEEHFLPVGPFETAEEVDFESFIETGSEVLDTEPRDAKNMVLNLLRQAWEKHCRREGFLAYEYANGIGFHVDESKLDIGKRIPWGRQGQRRNSMLRNISRQKVWEYGVSVIPSLFPYPHLKLKGRVLFSDMEKRKKTFIIPDKKTQFRLRRSVCSGWRNKTWHGRLMAFMELLAGDSPYVDMSVGSGLSIAADAMPVQFTSPVTARQINRQDEDAEEIDQSTLGGHFEDEDA